MSSTNNKDRIRQIFDDHKAMFNDHAAQTGMDDMLKRLSQMVGGLQQAGLDVRVTVDAVPSMMALSMAGSEQQEVPLTGIIYIGETQRLFSLRTKSYNESRRDVIVSQNDVRHHGMSGYMGVSNHQIGNRVESNTFNTKRDGEEAWSQLEKSLISACARLAAIADYDIGGVLTGGENKAEASSDMPEGKVYRPARLRPKQ